MSEIEKRPAAKNGKKKKEKWQKPRHYLSYGFMHIFFRAYVWAKMGFTAKLHKLNKKQGYVTILTRHTR